MKTDNKKIPVSVVISAFNEESKIKDCLDSVSWADEIIVINNSSTDATATIAEKAGAKVFTKQNNLMLNINKNFGFEKASHEWILNLDADERSTPELAESIGSILEKTSSNSSPMMRGSENETEDSAIHRNDHVNGFWIPRKNIIFGKWIQNSIWWPDYQLRLFRKGKGKFAEKHIHEKIEIAGETAQLTAPIMHLNYETISQFLYKMDKIYTENEARNILESGKKLQWFDAIRMPLGDFLKTFFLQKGYKDGLHGLVLSFLQAFYAEITFAKVWEKQGFPEYNSDNFIKEFTTEFKKAAHEFYYWILTALIDTGKDKTKKVYYQVLRKKLQRQLGK